QHVALLHGGYVAAIDVQVGTADRGRGYLHDGVTRVQDLGIRSGFHTNVFFTVIAAALHRELPRLSCTIVFPCAVAIGISPASSSCLRRRRSSRMVCDGSFPARNAINAPARPPGGAY